LQNFSCLISSGDITRASAVPAEILATEFSGSFTSTDTTVAATQLSTLSM
jgi:hypothetical protein